MKQFSTQFATQKLRETLNEVKFTIDDSDLYSAVMDRYMRGASVQDMLIKDEGDYLETDEETFQGVQAIAMDLEKVDALVRLDGIEEMSATGAGANFVPGTGEQYATPKVFKKIVKKKIKEGASSEFIVNKVWDFLETRPFYNKEYMPKFNTAKEIYDEFGQKELELYSNFDWKGDSSKIHPREKAALQRRANYDALKGSVEEGDVEPKLAAGPADIYMKKKWGWKEAPSIPNRPSKGGFIYKQIFEGEQLDENYSRFKKETKTRTNEQQLHAAMRLAEKKIHEANRILEYTAQLRTELNETKVNKNTQKLMEKITRGIAEAYGKMKKMK